MSIVLVQTTSVSIKRVKLLLQNQGEMFKQGSISGTYTVTLDLLSKSSKMNTLTE